MISPFDLELDSHGRIISFVCSSSLLTQHLAPFVGRPLVDFVQTDIDHRDAMWPWDIGPSSNRSGGIGLVAQTEGVLDSITAKPLSRAVLLELPDVAPHRLTMNLQPRLGVKAETIGYLCRFAPVNADSGITNSGITEPETLRSLSDTLMDSSVDCIKLLDLSERLLTVNGPGLCTMEIDDPQAVVGAVWSDLWPETSRQMVRESFRSAVQGQVSRFHGFCPTAKGSPRWWDVVVAPVLGSDGEPNRILALSRDVTEVHLREPLFLESEDRFETLANSMSQLAWMADSYGYIFWYNRRWYEYTGTTLAEMAGWGWKKVHHEDHVDRVVAKIKYAFENGIDWEDTFPLRGADGDYRWFLSRMTPIRDRQGNIVRWLGTNTDITDRLRVEEELQRSEQKTQLGAALGLLGLAEIDYQTGQVELTPTAAEILGFPAGTTTCARNELNRRCHPEDYARVQDRIDRAIEGFQDYYADEHRIVLQSGEVRWVNIRKHFFYETIGGHRQIAYSLLAARDTTEEKRFQAQLLEARLQADVANRAKSDFLANMSHEIRTPMTAILGYAQLLKPTDDVERGKIETILRNGQYLMTLLNDILDLSKIEAGKVEIESLEIDPRTLVEEVCSLLNVRAAEKSVELSAHYAPALPHRIVTDPVRLRQILLNLVGNAVKFTERGTIRIHVDYHSTASRFQLQVTDSGCGIADQDLPKLFLPFGQGDSSVSRTYGGSGLGLVISKRLAELLGGTIEVQSRLGEGSCFTLTLTNVQLASSSRQQNSLAFTPVKLLLERDASADGFNLADARILVVDDRRDVRLLAAEFIRRGGGEVETAEDGRFALEQLEREQNGNRPFDLLVMDVQMPKLDGISAIREVRRRGYRLPAIALTANATEEERAACLNAGYSEFITKPIHWERLIQTIAILLNRS